MAAPYWALQICAKYFDEYLKLRKTHRLQTWRSDLHTYIHITWPLPQGGFSGPMETNTNRTEILLRIPAGERLTSRLFTKRGGVEFGTTEDKSIQWQDAGFEPVTSGLQVRRLTTGPRLPPFLISHNNTISWLFLPNGFRIIFLFCFIAWQCKPRIFNLGKIPKNSKSFKIYFFR